MGGAVGIKKLAKHERAVCQGSPAIRNTLARIECLDPKRPPERRFGSKAAARCNANRQPERVLDAKQPPEQSFGRKTAARTEFWTKRGRQNLVLDAKRPPERSFGRKMAGRQNGVLDAKQQPELSFGCQTATRRQTASQNMSGPLVKGGGRRAPHAPQHASTPLTKRALAGRQKAAA